MSAAGKRGDSQTLAEVHTEAQARAHARAIVARSGTSFLWGMRVLARPRRQAMYAIYAFCRAVDDIADEPGDRELKLAQLEDWRREIEHLYRGAPSRLITRALAGPVADFALPRREFLAIIDGMEMDVRSPIVAPSLDEFRLYCRRVAGAVGKLSIRVFGDTCPAAEDLAVVLGEALQTANVLRDVAEDAERGRLYLPFDVLEKYGIEDREPAAAVAHPGLAGACAEIAASARDSFARARGLLAQCSRRRMRPATLMLESYERILTRLERRGWDRPDLPVRLSRPEKLWIALRYLA